MFIQCIPVAVLEEDDAGCAAGIPECLVDCVEVRRTSGVADLFETTDLSLCSAVLAFIDRHNVLLNDIDPRHSVSEDAHTVAHPVWIVGGGLEDGEDVVEGVAVFHKVLYLRSPVPRHRVLVRLLCEESVAAMLYARSGSGHLWMVV